MIRYSLTCAHGHGFDAWFSSIGSYDEQVEAEAVTCPSCGSTEVKKAPMAPSVRRGKADSPKPVRREGQQRGYALLKDLRAHLEANADNVGPAFPEEARKIHYGEAEPRSIYGEASAKDAKALAEEGIPALPLPPLPDDHN